MKTSVSLEEIYSIVYQEQRDPFKVLGPHAIPWKKDDVIAIRCFLPDIEQAQIIVTEDNSSYPLRQLHSAGFYEAICSNHKKLFPYKIKTVDKNGISNEFLDPYAFSPQLSDFDLHLLQEGAHYKSYEKLGAHLGEIDGVAGVTFAVWAPNARSVSVIGPFNRWNRHVHMMKIVKSSGIWTIFIPELGEGTLYKYQIVTGDSRDYICDKADPYGFAAELSPQTASIVYDIEKYAWQDHEWLKKRPRVQNKSAPICIYEVHLGSWARKSAQKDDFFSYRELADNLVPYVKKMGYTHIELLPIQEHPFYGSWGYQVIGYYAPTSRYGRPEDFMYFIDRCHQQDIGVILDWAPAHFPTDAHGLVFFDGTHLYEHPDPRQRQHKEWNTYIYNYGRYEVKNFLLSNALFWLQKYHIDGLRVDAVASMLYLDYAKNPGEWSPNKYGGRENLDAVTFVQDLNTSISKYYPGVLCIAEESTTWPKVSGPVYLGGLGFTHKWNMGWMNDILKYLSHDPILRKYHHHTLSFSIWYAFSENFILPLSHDEVVHLKRALLDKMPGTVDQKFANLRVLYGFMYAHPGKKLLFMGGEFGQWREWNHDRGLDWHLLGYIEHQQLHRYVRELNFFYRDHPALYELDHSSEGFQWVDFHDADFSVISFWRKAKNEELLFIFNFTPVPRYNYRLGINVLDTYLEIFNSDAKIYGGHNIGNLGKLEAKAFPWHDKQYHINVTLPPLSMLVFKPKTPKAEREAKKIAPPVPVVKEVATETKQSQAKETSPAKSETKQSQAKDVLPTKTKTKESKKTTKKKRKTKGNTKSSQSQDKK